MKTTKVELERNIKDITSEINQMREDRLLGNRPETWDEHNDDLVRELRRLRRMR